MEFSLRELAVGGGIAAAGFLARWIWDRFWRVKDDDQKIVVEKKKNLEARVTVVESTIVELKASEGDRQRTLGRLESEQNRLDGKVDGLQNFWRTEFSKLADQFKAFEAKVEGRLDLFRGELREDQRTHEERLTTLMTSHQERMHDRLNIIAGDQAKMLNEFVDRLVDKKGE